MKLRETVNRVRRNKINIYEWDVKHLHGNKYYCPDLDFTFNAETGETTQRVIGQGYAKIGETFKSGPRAITYELIIEE
jgi:hypothetical protein